jgi:hypothetical protein
VFRIDAAISGSKVAASAFVGAATDEHALRAFRVAESDFLACRYDVSSALSLEQIEVWRARGLRFLGFRRPSGAPQPPSALTAPLQPGDAAIVAGPAETIRALLAGSEDVHPERTPQPSSEAVQ